MLWEGLLLDVSSQHDAQQYSSSYPRCGSQKDSVKQSFSKRSVFFFGSKVKR